jgi:hypothetical protein
MTQQQKDTQSGSFIKRKKITVNKEIQYIVDGLFTA